MSDERMKEIKRMQNEIRSWSNGRKDKWENTNRTDILFYFGMLQTMNQELIQELEEHM